MNYYNRFDKNYNKFDVTTYERRESLDGTAHYRATHQPHRRDSYEAQDAQILHDDFKKLGHVVKDSAVSAKEKIGEKLHKLKEKFKSQDEEDTKN